MRRDDLDVLVVGAGFSGLYILRELLKRGYNVHLFDDGEGPGGTWDKNRYPGARVDSPIWIYQFTDPDLWENFYFSEKYPGWRELVEYFKFVCDRWALWSYMTFRKRVTKAFFDEDKARWEIETADGERVTSRFFILATGSTTQPIDLGLLFKGVERFKGEIYHSARWPRDKDESVLKDKRVAVIGTGASGIQVIQEAALLAESLTVFQRTPNFALPMGQERWTRREYELLKQTFHPIMERTKQSFAGFEMDYVYKPWREMGEQERRDLMEFNWRQKGFYFWFHAPVDFLFDEECNRAHYDFWREKTVSRIKKEELIEKLAPKNPPHYWGVKRITLEQWYYEVYNQDNVELVDVNEKPIETFTERGIVAGGKEYEFDLICAAVGFDNNTGAITAIDIRNHRGDSVKDLWSKNYLNYLGKTIPGFPNFFYTYALHAPTAFLNGSTAGELEGDWVVKVISDMDTMGVEVIEPKFDASEQWHEKVVSLAAGSLIMKAKSWYVGANVPGKRVEVLQYVGGQPAYRKDIWEEVEKGYPGFILR